VVGGGGGGETEAMRDFLIVLPFAFLVDVWPIWAAVIVFNYWYRSSHDRPIVDYLLQTLGAVLVALVWRFFESRKPVLWQGIAKGRILSNLLVAVGAGFLATFAHGEVIELTGSPSPDQLFYVGRFISMVALCFVLVMAYCVSQIIYQSADTVRNLAPGPAGDASRSRHALPMGSLHHSLDDGLYLSLAAVQSLVCIIDLMAHQAAHFTWVMIGLLAGVFALFASCNICWSRSVRSTAHQRDKDS
jgi:hypothetical protein